MCLQSKWIFPRKATKDIVCYKILIKNENGYLKTPYQHFPIGTIEKLPISIEGGKRKSIKCNIKNMKYFYKYTNNIVYSIMTELKCKEAGYIHAFTNLHHAKWFIKFGKPFHGNYITVKCIIPKGTSYHIAFDGIEICARKMIILENII